MPVPRTEDVAAGFQATAERLDSLQALISGASLVAIPYSLPGAVTSPLSIALTFPITLNESLCVAYGSGAGSVAFDLDGLPVASVSFPSGMVTVTDASLSSGLLTLTPSGVLSDLYITLSGAK